MLNNELEKQHDIVKRLFLSQKMTCDKCAGTNFGGGIGIGGSGSGV
jgi:hypothetical protein